MKLDERRKMSMPKSASRVRLLFVNPTISCEDHGEVSSVLSFKGQRCEFASLRLRFFGRLGIKGERLDSLVSRIVQCYTCMGGVGVSYVIQRAAGILQGD